MLDVQKYREGRRLHPMTLVQRFLLSVPAFILILLPLLRGRDANVYLTLLYILLIAVFTLPLIVVRYIRFRYWINPKEVVIRSGVFTIQHRNIPIERVQDIAIERNILSRMLGIAKVSIQTAGSQSSEGVLEYVSEREAAEIRTVVQSFKRMAERREVPPADDTSETEPSEPPPSVLFEMSMDRVLLSGAFRFSLLYVALFFSGMQYVGIDPEEMADWVAGHRFDWISRLADVSSFLLALVSLIAVTALSWLTGIAININRFYRFSLSLDGEKLQIRHGLATLAERTVPLRKVQAVVIRTNPLMKSFGWYALEIQTMGVEADQRGRTIAVPFARWPEIAAILPQITSVAYEAPLDRVSRVTIRRTALRLGFYLAASTAIMSLLWIDSWWLLALLPFVLYYAVCHYRTHGYAVTEDALVVRRGVFRELLWILPAAKFQVFYESASLFQRRLGVQSILIDMAGSSGGAAPVVSDVRQERGEAMMAELQAAFRRAGGRLRHPVAFTAGASNGLHPPEEPRP